MPDAEPAVRLDDPGLRWEALRLPGAEPGIRRVVLHAEGKGGASVQLVAFPPEWRRPGAGQFDADEEFVVLRGRLELSGLVIGAGEFGSVPRGVLRVDSSAGPEGCLAVAWFSAVPRWQPGASAGSPGVVSRRPVDGLVVVGRGHGPDPDGGRVTGPADVLTLDRRWTWVPEGAAMDAPAGPALVRLWRRAGDVRGDRPR